MGQSVTEKILQEHLAEGELTPGHEIAVRIDQTLTQDATGTMAYLQFEAMGLEKIRTELAVSYVDHNTVQVGPENADDHAYLRSAAARYGAVFSRPGNGICHQLHLERFGAPGKTLLGSDSHTPMCGGLGMVAIGAGGIDVAVAMGGGPFYMAAPRVIGIELVGRLDPWVSAKDVVLKVLEILGTKGNVGCVLEYRGSALKHLGVPARATIANMGAECGVTTSVFPSDDVTRRFLTAQARGDGWREVAADEDAEYARSVKINLGELEPLAAVPHSPGDIASVASLVGTRVEQVMIGSCTNSSYVDLKTVARILEGRKVHPDVSLGIAPGSRQVLRMLAAEGLLGILLDAGARLLESACGFCIGNSLSPGTKAVSLRTSNRNFEGRSGTPSARVFLVSPETAALAAVFGRITDPATMGDDIPWPRVREPKAFDVDDSMFIRADKSAKARKEVEVVRGPGIGAIPKGEALPDSLQATVAIKVGDKVTTDHIMPAGPRLNLRSNVEKYSEFVFENVDPGFAGRAAKRRDGGGYSVIVGGESYGQGSSREHAALCPMALGVRAVIAKSIERIHMANLVNFGILPFAFNKPDDYDAIDPEDELKLDGLHVALAGTEPLALRNVTKEREFLVKLDLSERQKQILLSGGLLSFMKG